MLLLLLFFVAWCVHCSRLGTNRLFENPLASQNVEAYMLHFMDLVARTAHNLHVYHKAV